MAVYTWCSFYNNISSDMNSMGLRLNPYRIYMTNKTVGEEKIRHTLSCWKYEDVSWRQNRMNKYDLLVRNFMQKKSLVAQKETQLNWDRP